MLIVFARMGFLPGINCYEQTMDTYTLMVIRHKGVAHKHILVFVYLSELAFTEAMADEWICILIDDHLRGRRNA